MPEMDGGEVARRIRDSSLYGDPAVVILSSIGQHDAVHSGPAPPVAAYLMKPVRQSQLMDTMAEVFALKSPAAQSAHAADSMEKSRYQIRAQALVVEDNKVNRRVATGMLKNAGCEVTEAENGRVAIEKMMQNRFDLVFIDIQMPEMDGLEATRRIRAEERWRDVPIIAMTARAMKGDRETCIAASMNDYISKPARSDTLRDMLAKWTGVSSPAGHASGSPPGAGPFAQGSIAEHLRRTDLSCRAGFGKGGGGRRHTGCG